MLCDCKMVVGERGAICLVHRPVHHAVHLNGQRNCHEKRRMRKTERITLYLPKGLNWAGGDPALCGTVRHVVRRVAPALHRAAGR